MTVRRRPPDLAARVLASAVIGGLVFVVAARVPKNLAGQMVVAGVGVLLHEALAAPLAQGLASRGS
jgi:hypothetical protein